MTPQDVAAYALRAEVRAVESGRHAWVQDDGSIRVLSETTPDVAYRVTFHAGPGEPIQFACTCASGQHRARLEVPCKHAALAGRRLEREHLAEWRGGSWFRTGPAVERRLGRCLSCRRAADDVRLGQCPRCRGDA